MLRSLKSLPLALPILLMLALAAMGFVLTSCNSSNQVHVRFVHAIWDAGQLDIDFNGTKEITDIGFEGTQPSSGYIAVPAGSDSIEGFDTGGTSEAFLTQNVSLTAGTQYTLVATGNIAGGGAGNVTIMNPADTNTAPTNGNVNFRVIDASPAAPSTIYVYIIQNPLLGNACQGTPTATLAYPATSGYVTLPYNSSGEGYTVYVCNAQGGNPLTGDNGGYSFNVGSLSEGSIRTLIFTDNATGSYINLPQPIILNDLN